MSPNLIFIQLKKIKDINEDIAKMSDVFEQFTIHAEGVYQLEMFYGDETLQALIDHSKDVLEEIDLHQQKYLLSDEEDILEEEGVTNFGEEE